MAGANAPNIGEQLVYQGILPVANYRQSNTSLDYHLL